MSAILGRHAKDLYGHLWAQCLLHV